MVLPAIDPRRTVRIELRSRARAEIHELARSELLIGSGEEADLIVPHTSVARAHARLLVRRGRLVLLDLESGKVTRVRGARVRAPAVLPESGVFLLGDLELRASLIEDAAAPMAGRILGGFEVLAELPSAGASSRRFRVAGGGTPPARGELLSARAPEAWRARIVQSAMSSRPHLAPLAVHGEDASGFFFVELLRPGLRLGELLEHVRRGALRLPLEARVVITAQIAEAIEAMHASFGPHGGVDASAIHLGDDGSLVLLRPEPEMDAYADPRRRGFLSPERRCGAPPSVAADVWALARVARGLGPAAADWPREIAALLARIGAGRPEDRPSSLSGVAAELRSRAQEAGLDPAVGHLARVVRLLEPGTRPLATVRPAEG